jgi:hypothetical protein
MYRMSPIAASMIRLAASFLLIAGLAVAPAQAEQIVHRTAVPAGEAISTGGSFSVRMPVAFADIEVVVDDGGKGREVAHLITGRSPDGLKFVATEISVSGEPKPLTAIVDSMKARPGAVVSDVVQTKTADMETISLASADPKAGVFMRIIRTQTKGYTLIVEYPVDAKERANAARTEFFDSFKMLSH